MLTLIQRYPIAAAVIVLAILGIALSLARAGVLALHAWRVKQTAEADTFAEKAKLAAIDAGIVVRAQRRSANRADPCRRGCPVEPSIGS